MWLTKNFAWVKLIKMLIFGEINCFVWCVNVGGGWSVSGWLELMSLSTMFQSCNN